MHCNTAIDYVIIYIYIGLYLYDMIIWFDICIIRFDFNVNLLPGDPNIAQNPSMTWPCPRMNDLSLDGGSPTFNVSVYLTRRGC